MHHASYFSIYYRYDRKKPVLWTQTWVWILAFSFAHCIIWASHGSSLSLGFFNYNMAKAGPLRDIVWILNNHKFLIPLIYLRAGLSQGTLSSLFFSFCLFHAMILSMSTALVIIRMFECFKFWSEFNGGKQEIYFAKEIEFTDFRN